MQWKVRHLGPNPCRNDGGSWVFLIARMYPVFEGVPAAMNVIAFTGAFTAFLGATIAITQNDIKRVSYSTISQLGYMVMAMGVVLQCWAVSPNDPRLL